MLEIEGLKRLQARLGLGDEHVVEIGDERFVLAHTDEERAEAADCSTLRPNVPRTPCSKCLARCDLHDHLEMAPAAPCAPGLYVARPTGENWEFEPLSPSLSPNPRPKLVVCGLPWTEFDATVPAYNAMIDEIELLSAALVAAGVDPKAVVAP